MSEKGLEKRVYMFTTQGADEKVPKPFDLWLADWPGRLVPSA